MGAPLIFNYDGSGYYFSPMSFSSPWQSMTARTDTYNVDLEPGEYTIGLRSDWDSSAESGSGFSGNVQINAALVNSNNEYVNLYISENVFSVSEIQWLNNKNCLVNCGSDNFEVSARFIITESGTYTINANLLYNANNATISATLNSYDISITICINIYFNI